MAPNYDSNKRRKDCLHIAVLGIFLLALIPIVYYFFFYASSEHIEEKPAPVEIDRPAAKPEKESFYLSPN